jgi:hydroxymethylglutaryl-CoA lyase
VSLDRVTVREVGPRDGFQMEKTFIPTEQKLSIINKLIMAGLKHVEVTSFVHPRAVPQLKDAEAVVSLLPSRDDVDVVYSALIVNERGLQRAVQAGIREVQMIVSASESHCQRNVQMTINQAILQTRQVASQALQAGITVRSAVAMAFGCPFDGAVSLQAVERICQSMVDCGIVQITLADTAGLAHPGQVKSLVEQLKSRLPGVSWGLHFHDTRGLALANIYAALESGVDLFESSIGGLGGCPFVPGATGNVATEDLVNMLEMMGVETGISLEGLLTASSEVQHLLGRDLPARIFALARSQCRDTPDT